MSNPALKILIVEDSIAFSSMYKNILESKGYKVFVTNDGRTELEIYEKELKKCLSGKTPFDLIISDNLMVDMNGVEAGKKILSFSPDQRFLFVTSDPDIIFKSFNVDGKNIDVEQKPISAEVLINKVELLDESLNTHLW